MNFTSGDCTKQSVPALDEENFLSIVEVISVDEAQKKYQLSNFIYTTAGENDYTDTSGQTWCVYRIYC